MSTLRPYQAAAVDAIRRAWLAGARRPLLVSPTGSGKTRMMCAVVEGAMRKGRRVLWLAHRTELVSQAAAQLTALGVEHGVVQGQRNTNPTAPMQVCSVATLSRRGEAPDRISVVLLDEAHHATAGTWRAVVGCYPDLELVLGATATPQRGDGTPLGDVFDHLHPATTVRELQRAGFLVPVNVVAPAALQDHLAMPVLDAYRRLVPGSRALVFCGSVDEAEAHAGVFRAQGIPAASVDGTTHTRDRARMLADFKSGKLQALFNVFCLTEGTDLPPTDAVIIARGCSVWAAWIQMIGRGLRPAPGKSKCTVVDLRGFVHVHGLPDDDRVLRLQGSASSAVDQLPALASCKGCGACFRYGPPACPRCGWAAPPRPRQRVKPSEMSRVSEVKLASFGEKRAAFEALCEQARARGYKPAWVGMKFKSRFGHWPPWPVARAS